MTGVAVQPADVTVDDDGSVAVIWFGTGQRLNALRTEHWEALEQAATALASRSGLRAVVLRGRGGVFCAGSDLREWEHAPLAEVDHSFWQLEQALRAIEDLPVPTVAVVEGVAAGGGCQLALACDLQVTAATAQMGMPISRLGILPSASFASRMALRIGPSRTKDLLYGGRMLSGEEAYRIGLVSTLVREGEGEGEGEAGVEAELERLMAHWSTLAPASLRSAKAAVARGLEPLTGPARREPPGPAVDAQDFPPRIAAFFDRPR